MDHSIHRCQLFREEQITTHAFTRTLFDKDWVVYAKRPFGNTHSVIEYLGRYTHKVAISNHRIQSIENGAVSFTYKDYRKNGRKGIMTLSNEEFVRRFALHILPQSFVRIRHYGLLSGTWKRERLPRLQRQLGVKLQSPNPEKRTLLRRCPHCKTGTLVTIMTFSGRDPPEDLLRGFLSASCWKVGGGSCARTWRKTPDIDRKSSFLSAVPLKKQKAVRKLLLILCRFITISP